MRKRCVKCGRDGFRMLCPECFLQEHVAVKGLKNPDMKLCARCSSLFCRNRWVPMESAESAVSRHVTENLVFSNEVKSRETLIESIKVIPHVPPGAAGGNRLDIPVDIRMRISCPAFSLRNLSEVEEIEVRAFFTLCPKCSRDNRQYYEGILQLRDAPEDAIKFIEASIDEESGKGVFITKRVSHRNGIDYYITSARYCRNLADKLHRRFGCEVKRSAKLYTYDASSGRDVYRPTILLRFSGIAPGSAVMVQDKVILVSSITGSMVNGTDIVTGKRVSLRYGEKPVKLRIYETRVSKVRPRLEVLHPETFESVPVENPRGNLKQDDKVRVAIAGKRLYLC